MGCCASQPEDEDVGVSVVGSVSVCFTDDGPLGLVFEPCASGEDRCEPGQPRLSAVREGTQATAHKLLQPGMLLQTIDGRTVSGVAFQDVLDTLQRTPRPCTLVLGHHMAPPPPSSQLEPDLQARTKEAYPAPAKKSTTSTAMPSLSPDYGDDNQSEHHRIVVVDAEAEAEAAARRRHERAALDFAAAAAERLQALEADKAALLAALVACATQLSRPDAELQTAQDEVGTISEGDYPAFKERAQAIMRRAQADDEEAARKAEVAAAVEAAAEAAAAAAKVDDVVLDITAATTTTTNTTDATASSSSSCPPTNQQSGVEAEATMQQQQLLLRAMHARLLPRSRTTEGLIAEQWEETWENFQESRDPEGEQTLRRLADHLRSTGIHFQDSDFPAATCSLFRGDVSTEQATAIAQGAQTFRKDQDPFLAGVKGIEWKTLAEIGDAGRQFVCFSGDIHSDDICQGRLGDCYYLAALASCAVGERDILLRDLIVEDFMDIGLLGVKFFLHGRWRTVIVDDSFPCVQRGGLWQPIFASPSEGEQQDATEKEAWVMIMEKAWAKLHGSFEATAGGLTCDTLNYLSGGVVSTLPAHGDKPEEWASLLKLQTGNKRAAAADKEKNPFLSCAVARGVDSELCKLGGLINGHAYSVLSICEASSGEKMLCLRNPYVVPTLRLPWGETPALWCSSVHSYAIVGCTCFACLPAAAGAASSGTASTRTSPTPGRHHCVRSWVPTTPTATTAPSGCAGTTSPPTSTRSASAIPGCSPSTRGSHPARPPPSAAWAASGSRASTPGGGPASRCSATRRARPSGTTPRSC
jgi:hypothetical protein